MSPEELETHNKVKSEVSSSIHRLVKKLDIGEFFSDRTLVSHAPADLSTEPDACFVSWEGIETARATLVPRADREDQYVELLGTPDWAIEVVSRFSVRKETVLLREAYHRADVSEYRLISAMGKDVDFLVLRWRPDGYTAMVARSGWLRSRIPCRETTESPRSLDVQPPFPCRGRNPFVSSWSPSLNLRSLLP